MPRYTPTRVALDLGSLGINGCTVEVGGFARWVRIDGRISRRVLPAREIRPARSEVSVDSPSTAEVMREENARLIVIEARRKAWAACGQG